MMNLFATLVRPYVEYCIGAWKLEYPLYKRQVAA